MPSIDTGVTQPQVGTQITLTGGTSLGIGNSEVLTATIRDVNGNPVISGPDATRTVTFAQVSGAGSLSGFTSVTSINGVANLSVSGTVSGSVGVNATAVLNGVSRTSAVLNITVTGGAPAGNASQIVLTGGISLAVGDPETLTAIIEDAVGNTVIDGADPDSTRVVTFAKTGGTGVVNGLGTATASGGVASRTITGVTSGTLTVTASVTLTAGARTSTALSITVFIYVPPPPPPPPGPVGSGTANDNGRGWLWWDGQELLNDTRFLKNLTRISNKVTPFFAQACASYSLNPTSSPQWKPLSYTAQPWHEPSAPESDGFLGFWVEACTLGSVLERTVEERGSARGGANFSNVRRAHREIAYTVVLAAVNPYSLYWGFDWLTARLAGILAADDTHMSALIRMGCADVSTPADGVWELRDAGMVTAPTWVADVMTEGTGCVLGKVNFVIGAADPCRYKTPLEIGLETRVPYNAGGCMEATKWLCGPFPELRLAATVPAPGLVGTSDVIVRIRAGATGTCAFRIRGGPNPSNLPAGSGSINLTTDMAVGGIGPYETLTIDASNETITRTTVAGVSSDGLSLLIPPAKEWPNFLSVVGVSNGIVWAEPMNGCGLATDMYVEFQSVHRVCQ